MIRLILALTLTLSLFCTGEAIANADLPGARALGEKAEVEAVALEAKASIMQKLYLESLEKAAADRERIRLLEQQVKDEKAEADRRVEQIRNETHGKWFSRGNMLIGGALMLIGAASIVFGDPRAGIKLLGFGVFITGIGYGTAYYAQEYALGGVIAGGLGLIGAVALVIRDLRKTEEGGLELADLLKQLENAGKLVMDKPAQDIIDQAKGKWARWLFRKATT